MIGTLVNICGAGRSGTTMLDLMIGNADEAFSCGEVYARYRPFRSHHLRLDCSCGDYPCSTWMKLRDLNEQEFHSGVLERLGVDFVVDSSKDLCWVIDNNRWARERDLHVVNLLIWKAPTDLAYSFWKRGGGIWLWRRVFLQYYGRFLRLGLPYIAVDFGKLTANPRVELKRLCGAVGIDYFAGKEEFWRREHHHLFGSTGTRKQVSRGQSTIRRGEMYPEQFGRRIGLLEQAVSADDEVQEVLSALRRSARQGVSSIASKEAAVNHNSRPPWYYRSRIAAAARTFFLRARKGVSRG